MTFSDALTALDGGKRVSRNGWNAKGLWVLQADGGTFTIDGRIEGNLVPMLVICRPDAKFAPWVASQTDQLATDWEAAP